MTSGLYEYNGQSVNLFQVACERSFRYEYRGLISTEDLWNLSPEALNTIAVGLYKQVQETEEVSFIEKPTRANEDLRFKLEIVKFIIQVKLERREHKKAEAEAKARKQRIVELIHQKEDEALSSKSLDELRQLAEQL